MCTAILFLNNYKNGIFSLKKNLCLDENSKFLDTRWPRVNCNGLCVTHGNEFIYIQLRAYM
jgi:hypothetical protein